jgi:pteridine reductase
MRGSAQARSASGAGAGRRPLALITGGVKRVGLATAVSLARAGCDLLITYRSSQDEAKAAAEHVRGALATGTAPSMNETVSIEFGRVDLDDLSATERFAGELGARLAGLDVLVHNASIYGSTPLGELTADEAMRYYRVNALAPLLLSKHLAPRLAESVLPGGGAIVAMLDIHAMGIPRAGHSAYAMSKAALHEMVRTLAKELAPRVRVNGVAPGVVAWPESGDETSAEMQARYLSRVPLARAGTPEEAAEAVRWLALDATYVTGHVIRIDGGRSLMG